MGNSRCYTLVGLIGLVLLAGCSRARGPSGGSGAREVVEAYFEALGRQDWKRAYEALHSDSRARYGIEQFTHLAQSYRRDLGFEPEAVHVRSCEEHGAEALAHVVLTAQAGAQTRSFKDAATLRRGAAGWGIVLSSRFGRSKLR
jgi:hypothetical protein